MYNLMYIFGYFDRFDVHMKSKRNTQLITGDAIIGLKAIEETVLLLEYLRYGPSLGGARPKATVEVNGELYLAKFSLSLDSKNEPLIEYATMTLAKKCGLDVPEILIERIDDRFVFLIKRFDRMGGNRTPFISGLTMTGMHESDYAAWSYFGFLNHEKCWELSPLYDVSPSVVKTKQHS